MSVGEFPEFVCPQGHRWRVGEPADRSDGKRRRCPICGHRARSVDPPARGSEGGGPTGRSSRDWATATPVKSGLPSMPGYTILGALGRGRSGMVYEAREVARDLHVALEVI